MDFVEEKHGVCMSHFVIQIPDHFSNIRCCSEQFRKLVDIYAHGTLTFRRGKKQ